MLLVPAVPPMKRVENVELPSVEKGKTWRTANAPVLRNFRSKTPSGPSGAE
jgi:hypothetical protein